jgi:hypothetical protein
MRTLGDIVRRISALFIAGACLNIVGLAQRTSEESVQPLLQRAGEFVSTYERDLSAMVADEEYTQTQTDDSGVGLQARRLRSDVLTVRGEAGNWIGFRDVYDVDGRPVRDRDDRLAKLFLQHPEDARGQAVRIANESARFNLIPALNRTINLPLLALTFLRPAEQARSEFKIGGQSTADGTAIAIVKFQERSMPRVIRTDDDAAAQGRFWIERESGRVRESELLINTRNGRFWVMSEIHVTYGEEPRFHAWVPQSMRETYRGSTGVIRGTAVYSKFRKFGVTTDEVVKAP